MAKYQVKTGFDNPLLTLVDVTPQPHTTGIQYTRRTYSADGLVHTSGAYIELQFDLLGTASEYNTLLTQFGLASSLVADVTVYIRNDLFAWGRYNGKAVRPETGKDVTWNRYFPRNIVILVKELEAAL